MPPSYAFPLPDNFGATPDYYVQDKLGSVRELVTAAGTPAVLYDYDPYGNPVTLSGSGSPDVGYAGYFHHAASGLDFAVFRAFDSIHGRWLNRDPIGEKGGINLYAYVYDNPLVFNDPRGLDDPHSHTECQGGKPGYVNNNPNQCTRGCTDVHELSHLPDVAAKFGANWCSGKPDHFQPNALAGYTWTFAWQTECRAYTAEKACLESLLNDCKCKADAQAALGGNASNINYYCNTKPPFP